MALRHVVEWRSNPTQGIPIASADMASIFIVGAGRMHAVAAGDRTLNKLIEVRNASQAAQYFGSYNPDYSLTVALRAIFGKATSLGGAKVIATNVLDIDSAIATTDEVKQPLTFVNDKIQVALKATALDVFDDATGTTTYILDTDYSYNAERGEVTRIPTGAISAGATVFLDYTYNSGGHKTQATSEAHTFSDRDTIQLSEGVQSLNLTGTGGTPTYVLTTDYLLDATTGSVTRVPTGAIPANGAVEATYEYTDPSLIQLGELIGTENAGVFTGLQTAKQCYQKIGYDPYQLAIPGYTYAALTNALETMSDYLNAIAVISAPAGTSQADLVAGRTAAGTINTFNNSPNLIAISHQVQMPDATATTVNEYAESHFMGVYARLLSNPNFLAYSPSSGSANAEVLGVVDAPTYTPGRIDNEAHALNEVGYSTLKLQGGGTIQFWGNRNLSYYQDTNTDPLTFISVRTIQAYLGRSIVPFIEQYHDRPITSALIDTILDSTRAFLDTEKRRKNLVDYLFWYDEADNPPEEVTQGKIVFRLNWASPPPAENIIIEETYQVALLSAINQAVA